MKANDLVVHMNQLIDEGQLVKAEKVADLVMKQFPVKYYEFYTTVEAFGTGYYRMGKMEKGRAVLKDLIKKYQEEITYFNGVSPEEQEGFYMEIASAIERYRSLLLIAKEQKDVAFYNQQKVIFNNYNQLFKRFGRENE